jgi:hypothetical protein
MKERSERPKEARRAAREKRLAEALRVNLKRRKAAGKTATSKGSATGKQTPRKP